MYAPSLVTLRGTVGAAILALVHWAPSARADFDYPDFQARGDLTLVGAASQVGAVLRLVPGVAGQAGGVWHVARQEVTDGFETSFSFRLGPESGADGFAFLLQDDAPAPLAGTGCQLGYHGLPNSVAVEFDTFANSTCAGGSVVDPGGGHISVHTLGTAPNSVSHSASLGGVPASFAGGAIHVAWVRYTPGELRVFLDDPATPVLVVALDLAATLDFQGGRARVGFTAATGGFFEPHDLLAWSFSETPPAAGNSSPQAPRISEPALDGQVVNPSDVHMETGPFADPDSGDVHLCSDWEIWTVSPSERVWITACARGPEALHTHLADGTFEASHVGRTELIANRQYQLRVRHRDSSGDAASEWSAWSTRSFLTGLASSVFPLELADVSPLPVPRWTFAASGVPVDLDGGAQPPSLRIESPTGDLLLAIEGASGADLVTNPPPLGHHATARIVVSGGGAIFNLAASDLIFVDDACRTHRILLPALLLFPGEPAHLWVSRSGGTYHGQASQGAPSFSLPARVLDIPWFPRQEGYRVEVFAQNLRLPVNIAFVPAPGSSPSDPFFYVSELYGRIRLVTRDGTVSDYAIDLLNYNRSGAFPGSGEQGLAGIAVDPATGDVYASMLYQPAGGGSARYPKIERFRSFDGGRTAGTQETILDMVGETQGQSHQISQLNFLPDGTLVCHMGDGFVSSTALNLESFRGKILRLSKDGQPVADNPFYDLSNGVTARDYVWAYGVRNPFGGGWRALDGLIYQVENGPSIDRLGKVVPGRNFGWTGSNASMQNHALYVWSPAHAPVNLVFVQPETFGGSGFPAEKMGHAFVTESGPTYATGPQLLGKRIVEFELDAGGAVLSGPTPFLEYAGTSKATACGLAAGPDGLYMTELYRDAGSSPTAEGARILRIWRDPEFDCNGNGIDDRCDIASGSSLDLNGDHVPDECQCSGVAFCSATPNSTGAAASIWAVGSCAVADGDFALFAGPVPQQPGLFYFGPSQVNGGAGTPFLNGLRCVGGVVLRFAPLVPAGSVAVQWIDFAAPTGPGQAIVPGSTWHFQYWFRDPAAGGFEANLSNGRTVSFY